MGGPVTVFFEACSKNITLITFPGLTLEQFKLLFNSWKEVLVGNPSSILIPEEVLVVLTSTVIASDLTGNISTLSPILEETFALSTPVVVASETPIVELSTILELEADTEPPPAVKSSIKPVDWKAVLSRIKKFDSDRASMTVIIYDFRKEAYIGST